MMNISVLVVSPTVKASFQEELSNCILQLKDENLINSLISATVFLNARDEREYNDLKDMSRIVLSAQLENFLSVNYVAQPPASGNHISFEVHLINNKDYSLVYAVYKGIYYARVFAGCKLTGLCVSGIQCDFSKGVLAACHSVYEDMDTILKNEGFFYHNIVRQWNYIENILMEIKQVGNKKQHYQIFNDVRSKYYARAKFKNGYPASTGIGMYAGGIVVSFYAIAESPDTKIFQVENPLQKSAYQYPDEVLVGEGLGELKIKSTPKFARAKLIEINKVNTIFISGTASIREEKTTAIKDAAMQTRVSIENIKHLISENNLELYGSKSTHKQKIYYYRCYAKDFEFAKIISKKCEEMLPGIPHMLVVSDICRQDLLVEIEAFSA